MAKYIMEEMPDLQNTGKRITYPKFARVDNASIKELPDNVQASIDNTQEELGKEIGTIISTVSELTVDYAGNIAKNLPNEIGRAHV